MACEFLFSSYKSIATFVYTSATNTPWRNYRQMRENKRDFISIGNGKSAYNCSYWQFVEILNYVPSDTFLRFCRQQQRWEMEFLFHSSSFIQCNSSSLNLSVSRFFRPPLLIKIPAHLLIKNASGAFPFHIFISGRSQAFQAAWRSQFNGSSKSHSHKDVMNWFQEFSLLIFSRIH